MLSIEPFEISVDPQVLDDLRDRITRTRWPADAPEPGWDAGTEPAYLRRLLAAWHDFDWAAFERRLNQLPHYRTRIDDQWVHFIHVRSPHATHEPLPIVLTHGWPGSVLEHLDLIPLLSDPADPADAFDVVIPSLPGFGFSDRPTRPGVINAIVADRWQRLMTEGLGYERFGAHGSDIGAGVTAHLGARHPGNLVGIHLSATAMPRPPEPWTEAERAYFATVDDWQAAEGAYAHQHATKPQTLSYGLTDSPAGLAGWIAEKYRDWSDSHGDPDGRIGLDRLLATLTLYWATGTIGSSTRMYYEHRRHGVPLDASRPIRVPAGFALFPNEFQPVPNPPRELAERFYQVERWRELPSGGHFPAVEEPRLLAEEIRAFFRPLRPSSL
ncbi:epoxide hydrolase [Hamadaea sp. NPDC051192]|uniref:epoxide hydrolase family protein n=1 Tax=Hamadaea sp. NPDC051192 TaxID=3154940 RepID=UPI00342700F7